MESPLYMKCNFLLLILLIAGFEIISLSAYNIIIIVIIAPGLDLKWGTRKQQHCSLPRDVVKGNVSSGKYR